MSPKHYVIGAGIAGLASAAYLIRDGQVHGTDIVIFDESDQIGGSLDAHGDGTRGYSMRGGRMFEQEAYTCTLDLMSFVPSLTNPNRTIRQEFFDFNRTFQSHAQARLISAGRPVDVSKHHFAAQDRLDLIELLLHSEDSLGVRKISEYFQASFFKSPFWLMWCTTFAFQPWHSVVELRRYLLRFIQEFPRIETLAGVLRTPYNQYDSIVRPLVQWLLSQHVHFEMRTRVTNLDFDGSDNEMRISGIQTEIGGDTRRIPVAKEDRVFATLGSMTAGSRLGTMSSAPSRTTGAPEGAWALWHAIAADRPAFGRPSVFDGNVHQSMWESFTLTFQGSLFFRMMQELTGNEAGTGGLVTFADSPWLMSVVLPHQPHFLDQPKDVTVCWGYGLFPDLEGLYVRKALQDCSGAEILTELIGHLHFETHTAALLDTANCIPCVMPYITSQFLIRAAGDRPAVVPRGAKNFAFLGQFCEIEHDVVFTVEYSVRSAQIAVLTLLGLPIEVSPIYKGQYDPQVLLKCVQAMLQ